MQGQFIGAAKDNQTIAVEIREFRGQSAIASLEQTIGQLDTVFDDAQGHYALMQVGWDRDRRVRGNLIYITLQDDRVIIEYDGIECGITQDLVASGVASDQIVLACQLEAQAIAYAS